MAHRVGARVLALAGLTAVGLALVAPLSANAQVARYYRNHTRYSRAQDWDRDGVPNWRDNDDDNDGVRDSRDRNDRSSVRYAPRSRVLGRRDTYRRGDRDRDGVPDWRDRHPGNRWRR